MVTFVRKARKFLVALMPLACCAQVNVLTFHNDLARTGLNPAETILTPKIVNSSGFGKRFEVAVDGKVDAQPLYVSGLPIPGNSVFNVVYAATEHDSVYAFDAATGRVLWHVSLLGSGEATSDNRGCSQVTPEIGITSTPVIDPKAGPHGTIYAIAMSKDGNGNYHQRLHALDLATGAEEFGGPRTVQATYPGEGANNNGAGQVVFDPKQYKSRPGILLMNGVLYTSWGSHCDIDPYTGWLIGYDQHTLQQTSVFNFAPNGREAALWNSGGAPAADSNGNIYVSVANGTFDPALNSNGFPSSGDYGNAVVKLAVSGGKLAVTDYWTMYNSDGESNSDVDLGSGGIMLLPDVTDASGHVRHLAVAAGKDTNLYVVNRDSMGKFDSATDGTLYQQLSGTLPGGIWGNPAYFDGRVYFGPVGSPMEAFEIQTARLAPVSWTTHLFTYPGVSPSVSANGTENGIVWGVENTNPAVLHAYDPANLVLEYYNSNQAPSSRDHLGAGNKYVVPTIANGQVFVGTQNSVAVFGVLPHLPLANGDYSITNQMSTLVLDDPASSGSAGTQLIQWSRNGGLNQKWYFTSAGAGYYTIRNESSGLYLAVPSGARTPGTKVEQMAKDGSDAQLWSPSISGSGYVLRNKASGLVMDDPGLSQTPGKGMIVWGPNGGSNQTWLIF